MPHSTMCMAPASGGGGSCEVGRSRRRRAGRHSSGLLFTSPPKVDLARLHEVRWNPPGHLGRRQPVTSHFSGGHFGPYHVRRLVFNRQGGSNINTAAMPKILAAQDQENLTYIHQTAAAAKPFHQGYKAPGAPPSKAFKTPLKPSLTNEDVFFKEGKPATRQIGKGNENIVIEAKGGANKASFITPAGTVCPTKSHASN